MRHYEVILLIHPDHSSEVPLMLERYQSLVKNAKGQIHRVEDLGRRQLAYPIQKVHKAHYVLFNIECDLDTNQELVRIFRFNDIILRYMISLCDKAMKAPSSLLREKEKEAEKKAQRIAQEATESLGSDSSSEGAA